MTLRELAAQRAAEARRQQTPETPKAPVKHDTPDAQTPPEKDNTLKGKYLALFESLQQGGIAIKPRTLRQIYDTHQLYTKYPPETPEEWETLSAIIAAISAEYGGADDTINTLLLDLYTDAEKAANACRPPEE